MISLNRNIQTHYIADHCIITNNGNVASVRCITTGKYAKRVFGELLLSSVKASLPIVKQVGNVLLDDAFSTSMNTVMYYSSFKHNAIVTLLNIVFNVLNRLTVLDMALLLSCIVLFVLIVF